MKAVALSALLVCATMGCAAGRGSLPLPATTSGPTADGSGVVSAGTGGAVAVTAGDDGSPARSTWIGASAASQYVLVGDQDQFVGVWVDVPRSQQRAHVPMAVTLTIDTSGSMSGDKIVRAREAAQVLVRSMKDGDLVSIQAFSGTAFELVAPTVLEARSRAMIAGTIAELSADGATNLHDALHLAIGRARMAPASHPVRRVVLISDGRATAGPTSRETLARVAESGAEHGVQVSALGVGLDYDEEALNAIAVRSSGRLYHLSDAQEMAGIIRGELGLLQSTMAVGAYVQVVPAPGVHLLAADGQRARRTGEGALQIPLGTLFSGQRRELLIRYRASGGEGEGLRPIVSARLHFTDPNDDGIQRVHEVVARASATRDATVVAAHQNADVQAIIAVQQAARTASEVRVEVTAGNFEAADQQLAQAESQLRVQASMASRARDRQRISAQAEGIARSRRAVQAAAKAPAPHRAKAARASSLELNDMAMDAMGY
ncbi:MAG: VWA domain-containing protein [Deltaproteobacteria bacterium]|jgi:Ca-activated chloride channel family protein|nr:VWA domain-containing protein [Deltaproteobacteria bacterium]MBW2533868.1 VWA domain-containing protein [Deltaproteobacteria bacterium]